MASAQGLIRALLAVVGLGMLFWLLAPQIQWAFHSATASSRAYPAHVPTETLPKDHDRDGSPQGPSSTPVAAPEERLRAARVVQTTESPALAHLTSHATPRPLNHTARPSTEPEPERATEPLAEAGNQSLGEEAEEPRVLERPGTFIAAGHLPKASKARVQPTGNIIMGNTKTVDLWEMVQQNTLSTVGCAGNATCPDLIQCANQRYVCTHNPLDLHAPPDFHMRDYYAEAYQDDKVFVLPNAIHLWNGNIVGLQKGVRPMHLPVGMCPWGVINSAKTDIMSMSLHLNRAASMVHPYAVNFYHFLAETLPKYYVLGPLLRTYKDTKLITAHKWARLIDIWFPQDNFTARSHNMKMWGAGKPKTKPKKGDHVNKSVAANQLFIQVQPRCGSPPMAHIAELRQDYLRNVRPRNLGLGDRDPDAGLILLYSRNNYTSRRAIKENDQLYTALVREYGMDVVRFWYGVWPTDLSGTAGPLAQASIFVGPHGAGLAAMLFLPPDAHVLELRQDWHNDQYSCFQTMAWAANISFGFIFGKGTRETVMSINVTKVVAEVRRLRTRWSDGRGKP